MRSKTTKTGFIVLILLIAVAARPEPPQSDGSNPSRLGLKGEMGYWITGVDASTSQPEIKVGDIVVASSATGQISNIEQFHDSVKALTPGQTLRAEVLRFDPSAGVFKDVILTLNTFAFPSGQQSRLGLLGIPGFLVDKIDPDVNQPGIKVLDFITETSLAGQIIDIEQFRTAVRQSSVGSTIQAMALRYDPSTSQCNELTIALTAFPFPKSESPPLPAASELRRHGVWESAATLSAVL